MSGHSTKLTKKGQLLRATLAACNRDSPKGRDGTAWVVCLDLKVNLPRIELIMVWEKRADRGNGVQ